VNTAARKPLCFFFLLLKTPEFLLCSIRFRPGQLVETFTPFMPEKDVWNHIVVGVTRRTVVLWVNGVSSTFVMKSVVDGKVVDLGNNGKDLENDYVPRPDLDMVG
jgi:hypothetical protein